MKTDDRSLLLSLKRGDRDAFDAIFKEYVSRVYHATSRFFSYKDEIEEVVQEIFIKIWEGRENINENLNFNAYLLTITKNHIFNIFRHKSIERKYLRKQLESSVRGYSIDDELSYRHLHDILISQINMLTPKQREILLLKEQGYDNDEIAGRLGISIRTAEWHISQAYRELRKLLTESIGILFLGLVL